MLCRHGATGNSLHALEEHEFNNQSVVYIGVDNTLAAVIRFEDKIREDAAQVVENLTRQGIDVYMLSGDKRNAANYVASVVGINQERVCSYSVHLLIFWHAWFAKRWYLASCMHKPRFEQN